MHSITASKGEGRFRYYVPGPKSREEGIKLRLPAHALEAAVGEFCERIWGQNLAASADRLIDVRIEPKRLVARIKGDDVAAIRARLGSGEAAEPRGEAIAVTIPIAFRRWRGGAAFFDQAGKQSVAPPSDLTLVKALARAHQWRALLAEAPTVRAAAEKVGANPSYFWRLTRLAYLAPDLTRRIVSGSAPGYLSLHRLMATDIPLDWAAQRRLLAE